MHEAMTRLIHTNYATDELIVLATPGNPFEPEMRFKFGATAMRRALEISITRLRGWRSKR